MLESAFHKISALNFCLIAEYVTGCPHLPIDGLDPPLHITLMEDGIDQTLPRAHTCFNQIVLPNYTDSDVLQERMEYALSEGFEGFHIS